MKIHEIRTNADLVAFGKLSQEQIEEAAREATTGRLVSFLAALQAGCAILSHRLVRNTGSESDVAVQSALNSLNQEWNWSKIVDVLEAEISRRIPIPK